MKSNGGKFIKMTQKEFFNRATNSKKDIIQEFLSTLEDLRIDYCVIDGIAINAYCEPIVTLDFDCVIISEEIENLRTILKEKGFKVKRHPFTLEVTSPYSDIRIHIQLDKRYQEFLKNAKEKEVLGYKMRVADIKDILIGKIWAYEDETRAPLKREKDLLDIKRIIEKFPELINILPEELRKLTKRYEESGN